ncbi:MULTISPECIES: signal peptidase II [Acidiphilium]|jgi:lipoprotein signal peptidase|uniref:Lipoprotein signal peptidase n=1 Tax=Acidiphilium rubrum TaxID=526 RepID=A0A8G2FFF4_ACIRU|nr:MULTISPECIES: signal peptidase II [Acidiphilium]OYW03100.1 MAG: signal peptidase II [Acidiphilium sp. 37-64-53]OZB30803.1 MAG: signal peptidase II [Acidiphilium sp. 34-64-41]SIQ32576.1 signal peptidase II [Acidiphilium rubrum]HQT85160.1 signal peptidase II [Acidiphilium rubrum]
MNRRLAGVVMALVVLLADQASKYWVLYGLDLPQRAVVRILPVLNFAMVWNHGVTFGILAGDNATLLLIVVAAVAVIALAVWLWRAVHLTTTLAVGAIIGGAIGNIISRVQYGAVVDFIDAHIGAYHWYVFNVADAAIVCGVGTLILDSMLRREPAAPLPTGARGDKEAS